jgi:hypothetical protein
MKFEEILHDDDLLDALYDMHFDECTPIQEQAIPPALEGRDLLAVAQTGTGKTAAYLLPIIERLVSEGYPTDAVNCVVMAPTRELAQQIDQQMQGFSYFLPVSSVAIYGGTNGEAYERQRKSLKSGVDVVIATPGRLLAHLSMEYVDLSKVSFFVLDEADRMLDMGFLDDIMQIIGRMPKERQTLMFSATMPPKIQQLANNILRDPVEVKLAVSKPAEKIKQSAIICYEPQKLPILLDIFSHEEPHKVIVFSSSKQKVKELNRALRKKGVKAAEMHSDLDQTQREEVILKFKAGKISVLVATDIMARGIDIDDIEMVVNFDVPREAEDYVHRVGRTARADRAGRAITFVSDRDMGKFRIIERLLEKEVEKLPVDPAFGQTPVFNTSGSRSEGRDRGRNRSNSRNRKRGNGNSESGSQPRQSANPQKQQAKPEGQPVNNRNQSETSNGEKRNGQRRHRHRHRPSKPKQNTPQQNNQKSE